MRKLNRRGKITLFSLILIAVSIFIGFQFHSYRVAEQTANAATVVKNKHDNNEKQENSNKKETNVKKEKMDQVTKKNEKEMTNKTGEKQQNQLSKNKSQTEQVTEKKSQENQGQSKQVVKKKNEEKQSQSKQVVKNKKQEKQISAKKENTSINENKPTIKTKKPTVPIVKPSEEKVVYLTFDDGPSNRLVDLMNILDEYQAKATFFWLEPNIKRFSNEAKDAVKRGFSIGLHGVTHDAKKIYASSGTVVDEMTKAKNTLEKITGYKTNLIRTPYGSYPYMTPEYMKAVNDQGFILWDWNVDSMDWKYRDSRYINDVIQQVQTLVNKNTTPVILMHDRAETIESLPKLLNYLVKEGYTFKEIDQNLIPVEF